MKIYFKKGSQAKTIVSLIKNGFNYSGGYSSDYYFQETFYDEACTKRQCHSARRSFLDLYWIAKTYFPKATKKQVAYILLNKIPKFQAFFCTTIKKVVFLSNYSGGEKCKFDSRMGVRYDNKYKGTDKVCFNDIINLSKGYEDILSKRRKSKVSKRVVSNGI